jgi:hypothetical protein
MDKPLQLLLDDISKQRKIAQKALEDAKELDSALSDPNLSPERQRALLEKAKNSLLNTAKELAANTTATSTSTLSFTGPGPRSD